MPLLHYIFAGIVILFITLEKANSKKDSKKVERTIESEEQASVPVNIPKSDVTRSCWTIRGKDVNHFRLFDGYLNFRVRAASARLTFYSMIKSNTPMTTFEINLGTSTNNSVGALHRYSNKYLAFMTPSIMKPLVYNGFWVRWNRNGVFAVGKEGEALPFMALQDFGPDRHAKTSQLSVFPSPIHSNRAKWLIQVPRDDNNCEMTDGNCESHDSQEITLPDNYKGFCEYLQMPQKKLNFSQPLNLCNGKSKEIRTPIGGEPSKFKFHAVKDMFNFGVKAEKHAELVFLESLKSEPYFTIVLAAQEFPSTSSLWITNETRILYDTQDIINKDTYSYFWVRWEKEGHIAIGHATDTIPFMVTVSKKMPPIRYVAFTTYTEGGYVIEEGNTTNGKPPKPVPSTWQERDRGMASPCAFVGGYICEECEPDPSLFCRHSTPDGRTVPVYVARVPDHLGIYPGHWVGSDDVATIVLNNKEANKQYFQILVTGSLEWVRFKLKDVPNAYPGGKTATAEHEPLYICRSKIENDCIPGYVAKSGQYCTIAYKGKAYNMTKYDILACVDGAKCPKSAKLNDG